MDPDLGRDQDQDGGVEVVEMIILDGDLAQIIAAIIILRILGDLAIQLKAGDQIQMTTIKAIKKF